MNRRGFSCGSLLTLLALVALFRPAVADTYLGHDVIGLATAGDESGVFEVADYPQGHLQLHLMVYGYDRSEGIVAWSCALQLPENVELTRATLAGRGRNALREPGQFLVTTEEPLPAVNGLVHLATLDLMTLDTNPGQFYIQTQAPGGSSLGPGFATRISSSLNRPFAWPQDCPACPVFRLVNNTQATDTPTWDGLKALFR